MGLFDSLAQAGNAGNLIQELRDALGALLREQQKTNALLQQIINQKESAK